MATSFPTSLDVLTNPVGSDTMVTHATQHADANDAIEALEAAVGVTNSAVTTSLQYRTNYGIHPNGMVLPGTSGSGVKLGIASPTSGWRDLTSDIIVRGSGPNDPSFVQYGASAFYQYQFSATTMQQVWLVYHVPHDYVPGTDIYFHAHWSNAVATPNTGNVVWGFEYTFAKGFNQGAFSGANPGSIITVTQACPSTRYQHMVAETTAVTISGMEVDGLILVRAYRDAAAAGDTCTDAVFLHTADIHFQSTGILTTKNKAPSFYV